MLYLTKWLIRFFKSATCIFLIIYSLPAYSQSLTHLTLDDAYKMARENYPLIKQKELIQRTSFLIIENINRSLLPQASVNAQATWQSSVTSIPVSIPGFKIDPPSKDQYKIVAEIDQLLYDGGISKTQKEVQNVNALVNDQQLEVELYKLKDRINQLYLGIILLDEQLNQQNIVRNDINAALKKVMSQVENGTVLVSNQLVLQAQLLQNDESTTELKATRKSLMDVMSLFINQNLTVDAVLEKPTVQFTAPVETITRPELQLYHYQDSLAGVQNKLVNAKNIPKASAFVQGGYGRPGLNLLKNEFTPYFIGGVKLSWSLGGFYTAKKEKEINTINQKTISLQKDLFVLNTNTQLVQQEDAIEKYRQLVETDKQIIEIRQHVKTIASSQLENGVITANDFLREVNAEDQAKQLLITHQVQLLQAQINFQTISGN